MPRAKQFDEQQTLDAAMELFWEKGFHATSMQDLVDKLQINRASLYNTYGDKEELFNKAFGQYVSRNSQFVVDFLNGYESVKEGLRALFDNSINACSLDKTSKGCFVVNTTTELSTDNNNLKRRLAGHKERMQKVFFNYLKKGQESGEIGPEKDLEAIAALIFTLYNGLMVICKVDSKPENLSAIMEQGLSVLD